MENIATKAKAFFSTLKTPGFSIISKSEEGWRCRVKLAVRQHIPKHAEIQIGLFQEGTHDIVSVYNCRDHHPRINEALLALRAFFIHEKTSGYNETTHTGSLRYLQCIVERKTGRVQVTLVLNDSTWNLLALKLRQLHDQNPELWHSFWINIQTNKTNTIFGKEWHHIVGDKYVFETICGYEVPFLPSHFGQANLEMFETLLQDLTKIFPQKEHVAELFSGIGIISTVLRPLCKTVSLYEIEPSAKESFLKLKKQLPDTLQNDFEFIVGDANKAHEICKQASTIIVDPPRKGVSQELLHTFIQETNIRHVVYISCCWKTFERDAKILLEEGFRITHARAYVFFPHTDHLETLSIFTKHFS